MMPTKYNKEVLEYLLSQDQNVVITHNGRLSLIYTKPWQSCGSPIEKENLDVTNMTMLEAMMFCDDDRIDPFTGELK